MIADYMSKPLQGKFFKTFRSALMGWTNVSKVFKAYKLHTCPKERVEDNDNKTKDDDNRPNTTKNNDNRTKGDNIGQRDKTIKFKLEETIITEKRIMNPTDNKEIRRRKNKSYVDAVKQHNQTILNEMNKHLIT